MENKVLIGHVHVDSGCVMIGDPCYSLPGQGEKPPVVYQDFLAAMDKADTKDETHAETNAAVFSSTKYGDGSYPVYAVFDGGNRPCRLIIEFDEQEEEEEEDYEED